MASSLRTAPGSSTTAQRKRLLYLGRKKGLNVDAVRDMVGGSLKQASSAAMSAAITRLGGGALPNPPGQKPPPKKRRTQPGIIPMITDAHVEQITRLVFEHFGRKVGRAGDWLETNYGIRDPRLLGSVRRAGEVIAVLKQMHARKARR